MRAGGRTGGGHRYGLPPPQLQFPVGPFLLDLAYPETGWRSSTTAEGTAPPSERYATCVGRPT
ncbi:hypothetical protein [Pseudonocardia charpentierae]|uniref:Uncharacterized protein n=1 Tax=Pseudonocardia charpentierae TaxID=3075545 RepID=A0ABU2N774_9PSEU|nr:hypothetical protein [Pseudonocardia sp. DSM 45834]MDT0349792.1 hypothetical protein [Pseudonocardia sp. DSM 45834]